MDALDDCFAPSYQEHQFDLPPTLAEFKGSIRYLRNTFAVFSLTIEDMVAEEGKVWARMTGRGTHSQEFMGRPPTGKSFEITVVDICRSSVAVACAEESCILPIAKQDGSHDPLIPGTTTDIVILNAAPGSGHGEMLVTATVQLAIPAAVYSGNYSVDPALLIDELPSVFPAYLSALAATSPTSLRARLPQDVTARQLNTAQIDPAQVERESLHA